MRELSVKHPCAESAELPRFRLPPPGHLHRVDAHCRVLDILCSTERVTSRSAASPSTTPGGTMRGAPPDMAAECRCRWILFTQLRGESHCSLRLGHGGDHCFVVDH